MEGQRARKIPPPRALLTKEDFYFRLYVLFRTPPLRRPCMHSRTRGCPCKRGAGGAPRPSEGAAAGGRYKGHWCAPRGENKSETHLQLLYVAIRSK